QEATTQPPGPGPCILAWLALQFSFRLLAHRRGRPEDFCSSAFLFGEANSMALSSTDTAPNRAPLGPADVARAMVANARWTARLGWDRYGEALATLFQCTWAGPGDAAWATAVADWQAAHGLQADGIIGPDTWRALSTALAPPGSPTGVTPSDAPPVPDGFDQI